MADWWVDDSAADNTASGQTYDAPKKWLWLDIGASDALFNIGSPPAAGDRVFVMSAHSEIYSTAQPLTNVGTRANPIKIITVTNFQSGSPGESDVGAARNSTVGFTTTTTGHDLNIAGGLWSQGIKFHGGDEIKYAGSTNIFFRIEDGELKQLRTGTSTHIILSATDGYDASYYLYNTNVTLTGGGTIYLNNGTPSVRWIGGTLDGATALCSGFIEGGLVIVRDVDLGGITYLVNSLSATEGALMVDVARCKLTGSLTVLDSSTVHQGMQIKAHSVDSGDTIFHFSEKYFEGDIVQATNCKRTNGAQYDGTNGYSAKMTSEASNVKEFIRPLYFKLAEIWCSANPTLTVHTITDNVTLQDDEFWIEVDYPDSTTGALGNRDASRMTNILSTPTNLTSDSGEGWTEDLTTEVKQKIALTLSSGQAGIHTIWACLAKASTTVYVCPKVDVT